MDERLIGFPNTYHQDRCRDCGAIGKVFMRKCKYCNTEENQTKTVTFKDWMKYAR